MAGKINLVGKDIEELEKLMGKLDEPSFRAEQIFSWIYDKQVIEFDKMTNLSKDLRNKLKQIAYILPLRVITSQRSSDGTEKFLFELEDGERIETVYLPMKNGRKSLCISTQVGCAMGCKFCATGLEGLTRNLTAGEIINQILTVTQEKEVSITNIVLMGMGEPLANYDEVMKAVKLINDKKGLNIGSRKITVSTCGLVPEIRKLTKEGLQLTLAVSLHAAEDNLRNELVPVNRKYPINKLLSACEDYIQQTGRRVSFEYALIAGVNDSKEQAKKLANLLEGRLVHVNLIPVNQVEGLSLDQPDKGAINEFKAELSAKNIPVSTRVRRGVDIDAACGQLQSRED